MGTSSIWLTSVRSAIHAGSWATASGSPDASIVHHITWSLPPLDEHEAVVAA